MRVKTSHTLVLVALLVVLFPLQGHSIEDLREAGRSALEAEDYFGAVEAFGSALALNPRDLDSLTGIANSYYWLGEYDQAEQFARQARALAGRDPHIFTLSGRIAIGLGDLEAARANFDQAITLEPNNVDAEIGLAELALAEGRGLDARLSLERALRINPDHRKAILSLVLIYEQFGDFDTAGDYLELALRTHGNDPATHILAAEYALRRDEIDDAASHARTAQSLSSDSRSAARLRASIALIDGRFLEASTSAEELLRSERTDSSAWYIRGHALAGLGELAEAMVSYRTALRYSPDNEVIRIVAEDLAIRELAMDDSVRAELASFVQESAKRSADEFRLSRALIQYQRALRLTPFNSGIRREYAEVRRTLGHTSTYLQELRIIANESDLSEDLTDRISVYENALSESVSVAWETDQFTLGRRTTKLALYLSAGTGTLIHAGSDQAILGALSREITSVERVDLVAAGGPFVFPQAFAEARSQDVDYFILLSFTEGTRSFGTVARVYVGRTGTEVATVSALRSGPGRVYDSLSTVTRRVEALFPVQMRIVRREATRVLIDAGLRDGLEVDTELVVLPPEAILGEASGVGSSYDPDAVLGRVHITAVDDLVSEGSLEIEGLDSIVEGDVVILPGDDLAETSAPASYPVLYDRIRALR